MLCVTIPELELYDENSGEFVFVKAHTVQLEHSLISLSKWESTWQKPFLSKEAHTLDEMLDYIRCMSITQNVTPAEFSALPQYELDRIFAYINDPMTATTIRNYKNTSATSRRIVTAELIYYWMFSYGIPIECQKWHLNRLLTLIQVFQIENSTEKMPKSEVAKRNRSLNAARRKAHNTKG